MYKIVGAKCRKPNKTVGSIKSSATVYKDDKIIVSLLLQRAVKSFKVVDLGRTSQSGRPD